MAGSLDEYAKKRDFKATSEPAGKVEPGADSELRFVLQEHSATRLHWDLRLEHDGVLVSFAIPNGLPPEPGKNHLAVHTEDHPLDYLEFHGDIPKGQYGAGTMTIADRGTYEVLKWDDGKKIEVHLHGERADAKYALFPLDKSENGRDWMIHRMDPPAGGPLEPIPDTLTPMLAKAGTLPKDQKKFAFEIKWDGVRALCHSEPGRLRLRSRNGNDITKGYPELARLNRALHDHRVILDGEIVAFDGDGRPSFATLQRRMHVRGDAAVKRLAAEIPVVYVIFDLLWLDGHSVMGLPYSDRRELLGALDITGDRWQVPDNVVGSGSALLEVAREQRLEGVVAKRLDSTYEPGRRSSDWTKVKLLQRETFVICGWLPGTGKRTDSIGALLLGERVEGGLRFAGRAGTGFTNAELARLAKQLAPLTRDDPPFGERPAGVPADAMWVEPVLSCEVEFLERTPDGLLRAPSYQGMSEESTLIEPASANSALVKVDGREVKLSNPDKVLYPAGGFAKRDLVEYYLNVAEALLPHIRDRRLTLKRYPDGVEGKFFYEKNAPSHRPEWVTTDGGFVVAADRPTLAWLGNLADLELHTSLGRIGDPSKASILAFDLDPGEGAGLRECCQVANLLHGMLEGLGLQSFAKTSGSKGLQVYVPLNDGHTTFEQTKAFSRAVGELLAREVPELIVAKQVKTARRKKVLVDWLQNEESKTTVCVYSPRARERPTVSTPLHWDEVREAEPEDLVFTTDQVLERIERDGDLFAPVATLVQRLPAA